MGGRAGTIRLGRIAGRAVDVHISLLASLPFFVWIVARRMEGVVLSAARSEQGAYATVPVWAMVLAAGLFVGAILHEAGHVLAARAVGMRSSRFVLSLLGACGVGERVGAPSSGMHRHIAVAAAGPFANLVAGVLLGIAAQSGRIAHYDARVALMTMAEVQLAVGGIALCPALPLDGGEAVAAALRRWIGRGATAAAMRIGRAVAAVVAIYGTLSTNLALIGLAGLIWSGSEMAASSATVDAELRGLAIRDLVEPPVCVDDALSIATLAGAMRERRVAACLVVHLGRLRGVIGIADVLRVSRGARASTLVGEVSRAAPVVEIGDSGAEALSRMRAARVDVLPVVDGEILAGLVTARAILDAKEFSELEEDELLTPRNDAEERSVRGGDPRDHLDA